MTNARSDAPAPFEKPVYVTRPLLPPLTSVMSRLAEVWATQQLTNIGPQHERLETALRDYLGVRELSLFTNGTVALITAIRALGLTGEVLTTPFTFPATPHALSWSGITPVFCDVDPVTLNIDPDAAARAVTARTSGILAVHVYGNPCDVGSLQRLADRHGLKIIYDAAHAFGTRIDGKGIGTYGDATMFSFHATKLFHTAEGGALACADPSLKARIDDLRNFGIHGPDAVDAIGLNGKMSELQAVLGLCVLEAVGEELARRRRLFARYGERFARFDGIAWIDSARPGGAGTLQGAGRFRRAASVGGRGARRARAGQNSVCRAGARRVGLPASHDGDLPLRPGVSGP